MVVFKGAAWRQINAKAGDYSKKKRQNPVTAPAYKAKQG